MRALLLFSVLHSFAQGPPKSSLSSKQTSLLKFALTAPVQLMNPVMDEHLSNISTQLKSVSFIGPFQWMWYWRWKQPGLHLLVPKCPNWIRLYKNGKMWCCKWSDISYQTAYSQFHQIICYLQIRQVRETFGVCHADSNSVRVYWFSASPSYNQSPSWRQCRHCSTALQSYLCLITSQRACHLSVLWHLNPIYTHS